MIIFNTPVPIRYIFKTLRDWSWNIYTQIPTKNEEHRRIHFIYFSYKPDYPFLLISLESLLNSVAPSKLGCIWIFEDQKAPFSKEQVTEIKSKFTDIKIKPIHNFEWASTASTAAEIRAFNTVLDTANDNDLIAKVDSDIVFFENSKLSRLLQSEVEFVGDGHSENYRFMQGGFYMFRKSAGLAAFRHCSEEDIIDISKVLNKSSEDRIVSYLGKTSAKLKYTRLMLFPSEYQNMGTLNKFNRWDFAAGHFVKDKERMSEYYSIWHKPKVSRTN